MWASSQTSNDGGLSATKNVVSFVTACMRRLLHGNVEKFLGYLVLKLL